MLNYNEYAAENGYIQDCHDDRDLDWECECGELNYGYEEYCDGCGTHEDDGAVE